MNKNCYLIEWVEFPNSKLLNVVFLIVCCNIFIFLIGLQSISLAMDLIYFNLDFKFLTEQFLNFKCNFLGANSSIYRGFSDSSFIYLRVLRRRGHNKVFEKFRSFISLFFFSFCWLDEIPLM